eukprot:s2210_g8.t1
MRRYPQRGTFWMRPDTMKHDENCDFDLIYESVLLSWKVVFACDLHFRSKGDPADGVAQRAESPVVLNRVPLSSYPLIDKQRICHEANAGQL